MKKITFVFIFSFLLGVTSLFFTNKKTIASERSICSISTNAYKVSGKVVYFDPETGIHNDPYTTIYVQNLCNGAKGNTSTDVNGNYTITLGNGPTFKIWASKLGKSYTPSFYKVHVTQPLSGQDFYGSLTVSSK